MNNTTPDPFLAIATRGHRPRIGKSTRVPFSSSTVDEATEAEVCRLMKRHEKSRGAVIDSLVYFAMSDPRAFAKIISL